ncbi:unnamed protein product [Gemmata massiliana]|uniref:Uncharacterized protein n=1 Tax=Gemmata massiliana TaxID=1210884 RepID=A0A6P2D8Y3_9BACT|nr:unnamed protein product [Gemmata massiliana]
MANDADGGATEGTGGLPPSAVGGVTDNGTGGISGSGILGATGKLGTGGASEALLAVFAGSLGAATMRGAEVCVAGALGATITCGCGGATATSEAGVVGRGHLPSLLSTNVTNSAALKSPGTHQRLNARIVRPP